MTFNHIFQSYLENWLIPGFHGNIKYLQMVFLGNHNYFSINNLPVILFVIGIIYFLNRNAMVEPKFKVFTRNFGILTLGFFPLLTFVLLVPLIVTVLVIAAPFAGVGWSGDIWR